MSGAGSPRTPGAGSLGALRRIAANSPRAQPVGSERAAPPAAAAPAPERCEMCALAIAPEHQHVVDMQVRQLMCVCRPCYLLFTGQGAALRFRAVPDRFLSFPQFALGQGNWDELEIPVGLAFFFHNSSLGRVAAFYPGPAGATESELPLQAWNSVVSANPQLATLLPDVEALIVRMPEDGSDRGGECYLVPIDACYELVGQLRRVWRGFDGGQQARARIDEFFSSVAARAKPAKTGGVRC